MTTIATIGIFLQKLDKNFIFFESKRLWRYNT